MAYFVYLTEQCRRDLERHKMGEEVERLRAKVEAAQTVVGFDRFPVPFLKKRFGRMRLLIEERIQPGDVHVLCFVRLVFRGDNDYESFLANPDAIKGTYEIGDLAAFVRDRQAREPPPSTALTELETSYLQVLGPAARRDDGVVFETLAWVQGVRDRKEYLSAYGEVVADVLDEPRGAAPLRTHPRQKDVGVLFRWFPRLQRTVLLAPTSSSADAEEERVRHAEILDAPDEVAEETLLPHIRRAYPDYILADLDLWLRTQKDDDANLALSSEETAVLDLARRADEPSGGFPLFINGRPGSGKSTILQYLFADLLFFHLNQEAARRLEHPPLYLTYSQGLLKKARDVVEKILRCDARNQLDRREFADSTLKSTLDGSFGYFRDFLRQLLPSDEARERYRDDRFLDFTAFQKQFTPHFARVPDRHLLTIGPEISWHIIRSYIKGMRDESDDFFDPDCYDEYPLKRRTVEKETFRQVYESIFDGWYRRLCEEDGYWDDQDLVREVLRSDVDLARYPGVFCDEAQDFTSIELEFIYRLSRYSRRAVPPHLLHCVPFAFAGDPFQTLNPTGFSWDSIKAEYHEKIAANIGRGEGEAVRLEFKDKELAFNYRSADGIVKLCNSIQLARGVLFSMKRLAPQKTWFTENAALPVYFSEDDNEAHRSLQQHPEVVVIVPCHEGGEDDYVKGDPFLKGFAGANVLSPMRAKGLEFSRVVLYKFGEEALATGAVKTFVDALATGGAGADREPGRREEQLPAEYFFNRLYVGASRAQNRLIVIDTERALKGFWQAMSAPDSAARLLAAYRALHTRQEDCAWSGSDLGRLVEGNEASWSEGGDDPVQLGEKFLEEGRSRRDPYLLERARRLFESRGETARAKKCAALLLELDGQMREAGLAYEALREFNDALRCLWEAGAYTEIVALGLEHAVAARLELPAAEFMAGPKDIASIRRFLGKLYDCAQDSAQRARLLSHRGWQGVFDALVEAAGAAAANAAAALPAPEEWKLVYGQIRSCQHEGGLELPATLALARLAHRAGEMDEAAKMGKQLLPPGDRSPWFAEARAAVEPYPGNLEFLEILGRNREIVEQYEQHRATRLTDDAAGLLKRAFKKEGRLADALPLCEAFKSRDELTALLRDGPVPTIGRVAQRLAELLVDVLVEAAEWEEAVDLCKTGRLDGPPPPGSALASIDLPRLRAAFVRNLAGSPRLADEGRGEQKKIIADFLRSILVDPRDGPDLQVKIGDAAAAIERAGQITDAIAFYERLLERWKDDPKVLDFARKRWLKNKGRHRKIVEENRRGAIDRDIRLQEDRWRISDEDIEGLPEIPDRHEDDPPLDGRARVAEVRVPEVSPMVDGAPPAAGSSMDPGPPFTPAGRSPTASTVTAQPLPTPVTAQETKPIAQGQPHFVLRRRPSPGPKETPPASNVVPPRETKQAAQPGRPASVVGLVPEVKLCFSIGARRFEGLLTPKVRRFELHDSETRDCVTIRPPRQPVMFGGGLEVNSSDLDVVPLAEGEGPAWSVPAWGLKITVREAGALVVVELTGGAERIPIAL